MQASSYNIALNQCVALNHVKDHVKNYRSVIHYWSNIIYNRPYNITYIT